MSGTPLPRPARVLRRRVAEHRAAARQWRDTASRHDGSVEWLREADLRDAAADALQDTLDELAQPEEPAPPRRAPVIDDRQVAR